MPTTRKSFSPPKKRNAHYFNVATTPVAAKPVSIAARVKAHLDTRKGATVPTQPLGTATVIPVPSNPLLTMQADDVAVKQMQPSNNPTLGAGIVTAPTAAQVIADTGPLPAGVYYVEVAISISGVAAAGKHAQTEHRNAANSATIAVKGGVPYPGVFQKAYERIVLALNERIRVVQSSVAGAAAEVVIAHIEAYLLPV